MMAFAQVSRRLSDVMRLLSVAAFAAALVGCASASGVEAVDPRPTTTVSGEAGLRLLSGGPLSIVAQQTLLSAVKQELLHRRIFTIVHDDGTPVENELRLSVVDGREVNSASRMMFGALAGSASLSVTVEVMTGGKRFDSFTVAARSSNGSIFAGTIDQAISLVATQIANRLQN